MTEQELKTISIDTLNLITSTRFQVGNDVFNMRDCINNTISNTKFYSTTDIIILPKPKNNVNKLFQVVNETTIKAALDIRSKSKDKIAILNFASAIKPGGGWLNGRIAQEEDIMRKTTLFPSLLQQDKFYKDDNKKFHFYSNDIIYSPEVWIIKDDNFNLIRPVSLDVITCAAINLNKIQSDVKLNNAINNYNTLNQINLIDSLMMSRIQRVLDVAIENNVKNLILGAFGCGVFGHNAKKIASFFYKLLCVDNYKNYFTSITFAVLDKSSNQYNYKAFYDEFKS